MSEQGFNDSTINTIVEQVLAKMGKPTLIVLTAANGYHHEIANQLATWQGIHWHILASQNSNQHLKNELMAVQHLGTQATGMAQIHQSGLTNMSKYCFLIWILPPW